MGTRDDDLIEIAGAILDGTGVDWDGIETNPDADQELIHQLRIVSDLAEVHRSAPNSRLDTSALPRWGHLLLIERVGGGAFGNVFRAWDTRLDREVALKLVDARDDAAEPLAAIEEGRLLARIRHPNVLTVHGAEHLDGRTGIWTEFIEGRTLDAIVATSGPLPTEEVIGIGIDLCHALGAVHDAGLLHRDVKAQNVMREEGGRIVLMDFGTGYDLGAAPARAGDSSGTPIYLAPEIFNGDPPSVASDVYALGVLLFFLLSGGYPVTGRTHDDIRQGHNARRLSRLRDITPVPDEIASVIERAIAYEPGGRFPNVSAFAESLLALRRAEAASERNGFRGISGSSWLNTRYVIAGLVAALLLASVLAATYARRHASAGAVVASSAADLTIHRLTYSGDASRGVISRSGRLVAYVRTGARGDSLWVHTVDSPTDLELLAPDGQRRLSALTIEPDERHIDFVDGIQREAWRVATRGGRATLLASRVDSAVEWAPDGSQMAFVREGAFSEPPDDLIVADADGSHQRVITRREAPARFLTFNYSEGGPNRPAWSPDGRSIALLVLPRLGVLNEIDVIDSVTGSMRHAIAIDPAYLAEVGWRNADTLVVERHHPGGGRHQLWAVDVKTHDWTPLTRDVADYVGVSVTAERGFIVSTRTETRGGIWSGGADGTAMTPVVPESAAAPRLLSFDEQGHLVFEAQSDEERSVWVLPPHSTSPIRVFGPGRRPVVSPDGSVIVLSSADKGIQQLLSISLDGSTRAVLSQGDMLGAAFAPDNRTVFFTGTASGEQVIWAVSPLGGTPRQITTDPSRRTPLVSPDGRTLIFLAMRVNGTPVVRACDLPDCDNLRDLPVPFLEQTWAAPWQLTPDGTAVGFVPFKAPMNLWLQPLAGGPPRELTHFTDRRITGFAWSPNDSRLAVARAFTASDVVMLSAPGR